MSADRTEAPSERSVKEQPEPLNAMNRASVPPAVARFADAPFVAEPAKNRTIGRRSESAHRDAGQIRDLFGEGCSRAPEQLREEIAELVRRRVPGSHVKRHPAATDRRHYRVDGTRIRRFCQRRAVQLEEGLAEISDNMRSADWKRKAAAPQSNRAGQLRHLLEQGELNDDLRWRR